MPAYQFYCFSPDNGDKNFIVVANNVEEAVIGFANTNSEYLETVRSINQLDGDVLLAVPEELEEC